MRPDGDQRQFWRTKISKCVKKQKKLYRGVAKLVSRQFRVLETVGSSPATSTKKEQVALAVACSFLVLVVYRLAPVALATWVRILSAERVKLACKRQAIVYSYRKSRHSVFFLGWPK